MRVSATMCDGPRQPVSFTQAIGGVLASLGIFCRDLLSRFRMQKHMPSCKSGVPTAEKAESGLDITMVEKDEGGIAGEAGGFSIEHGVEPPEEFMPIEHPMEPLENDQPVRCPQPEPCIIHDGRIWKQRLHQSMQRRRELPFLQETEPQGLQHRRHMVHTQHVLSSPGAVGGLTKCSPA